MPIDLSRGPIDPQDSLYQTMLQNLQGNILLAQKHNHTLHIFLKFKAGAAHADVRNWLHAFMDKWPVTSAKEQIAETGEQLFCNVFLSATGYQTLGYTEEEIKCKFPIEHPVDQEGRSQHLGIRLEFSDGMAAHAQKLNDPNPTTWDEAYRDRKIDIMILLADDNMYSLVSQERDVRDHVAAVADVLTVEWGHRLRKGDNFVEPFGYADGLSQPRFLVRGDGGAAQTSSTSAWDPSAPLNLVLLPDPFAPDGADCFGSYLVFRKLEQNVYGFHQRIQELAGTLGCSEAMAEALVLGRFKDGTPLVLSDGTSQSTTNNFNYSQDTSGTKCPFQAHIRRINPRGESAVNLGTSADDLAERQHRIARRGISYGTDTLPTDPLPVNGVGTLFMCFQRNLSNQFGHLQRVWANSRRQSGGTLTTIGIDPIIGQTATGDNNTPQQWPVQWGSTQRKSFDFHGLVTCKGGEFFFAPSILFLKNSTVGDTRLPPGRPPTSIRDNG